MKFPKQGILLLTISFVNSIAWGLLWPFITINIYMLGGSLLSIVFVQNFPYVAYLLSRLWGALSDYYGKRKLFIIIGQLLSIIPLFVAGFSRELQTLIILIILTYFFNSIASPSFLAALGEAGGGTMYAYSQLSGNIGWALGALIIGPLHAIYGQTGVYLTAAMALFLAICIFGVLYKETKNANIKESLKDRLKKAFSFNFRAKKEFKYFLLAVFLAWTAASWASELLKVKLFGLLGESVKNYSLIFGAGMGVMAIISSYVATKLIKRYGGDKLFLYSVLTYIMLMLLLGVVKDPTIFIVSYILPVWPIFWAGQTAMVYELSEKDFEAENMGVFVVVTSLAALPGILGGLFADFFNIDFSIVFSGVIFLFSYVVACRIIFYRKVREYE